MSKSHTNSAYAFNAYAFNKTECQSFGPVFHEYTPCLAHLRYLQVLNVGKVGVFRTSTCTLRARGPPFLITTLGSLRTLLRGRHLNDKAVKVP